MSPGNVVYVLPNAMGGMLNIIASLVAHRSADGMPAHVVLTDNANVADTRFAGTFAGAATEATVRHALPNENLHAVLRRLRGAIPPGPGVLVCNDLLELALLHVWDPQRMVVQILHGDHDYYYDLATRHAAVVDVFITYSRAMHDELRRRLPERPQDVLYVPYGVTLPRERRESHDGPLRVLFAGRLEHGQKGVRDLPKIAARLRALGVDVRWTVIGGGPDELLLRQEWREGQVEWRGALSRDALLEALPQYDVFVLPTRAEGLSVALVEAMGAGLVPVVSDIKSGVPELVADGVTGMLAPVGDIDGFADAVAMLAIDRRRLAAMSAAAHCQVQHLDPVSRARAYEAVFAEWPARTRTRARRPALPYGSRLDQPWLPNALVRSVRAVTRRRSGRPS
jgi:glycosyltransferase involved in cell wall biosynthesis